MMKNDQKGITLVALVITIIVLLILAGVSIAALSGQNGILTNATSAKQNDELGAAKDQVNLAANEAISAFYSKTYAGDTTTGLTATTEKAAVEEKVKGLISDGKIGSTTATITTGVSVKLVSSDGKKQLVGTFGASGGMTWGEIADV